MAGFRLLYRATKGEFDKALREMYRPMADAAKAAVSDVGDAIKTRGRAQIALAGFKRNYQTAFRVDIYPRGRKASVNSALVAYHKVDFSETFEEGARINGRPYLWLPLPTIKKGRVRRGRGVRLKDLKGYKLVMVRRPGKPPRATCPP